MSATRVRLFRGTYVDSVVQLAGTRAARAVDGVDWAAAAMATPANLDTLAAEGFPPEETAGASANDLVVAVRAGSDDAVAQAREAAETAMFAARSGPAEAPCAPSTASSGPPPRWPPQPTRTR
jgi:FdrA protein